MRQKIWPKQVEEEKIDKKSEQKPEETDTMEQPNIKIVQEETKTFNK